MPQVCVVGGGAAGSEATLEMASRGGDVVVVDPREGPQPPWRNWPDLIGPSSGIGSRAPVGRRQWDSSATLLTKEAKSVGPGFVTFSDGVRREFDSVIIATGSSFAPSPFRGLGKPGVYMLDSPQSYAELGRNLGSVENPLVAGEGLRGLQVAEKVSGQGRKVHLIVSHWQKGEPTPPVYEALREAAARSGVLIQKGEITRAVGEATVEAVVVSGEVLACDSLALVPRRIPKVVATQAQTGPLGGIAVERDMRTTIQSTFAAGGCAEVRAGIAPSSTLDEECLISGRIAASNSMGGRNVIARARYVELLVFGLRWTRAGMEAQSAASTGGRVAQVGLRRGLSACTILYDRPTQRVVGFESLEPPEALPIGGIPLEAGPSLASLFYGLGSSDISVVPDTARLGLRQCQRS